MVKFVVTLYVLECFDSFWNCLVSNICDLISAANGCRMVSMNSLCHQVAERLQLVIAPASLGDCNELTPADGNPKHVKIPSAIHSYLWHLGRCQLGTCPDQIPTLKKVSVLVYRMISSSTWARLLRMAFNIQDTIQQFYSREPFLWFDIQVATHQKFC